MGKRRIEVADFWDEAFLEWHNGDRERHPDLNRWLEAYTGGGRGQVNLRHFLDPYVGDLRGARKEPRLVALGLNPGESYDELQARNGIWTKRILGESYSRCFLRSPAEDPRNWLSVRRMYGKRQSPYWSRLVGFAKRWLGDSRAGVPDILNFELFPWHSDQLTAGIETPPDLAKKYIFDPVEELSVTEVFAFGRSWFDVAEAMNLRRIAPPFYVTGAKDPSHWKMAVYELPSGQVLVVSSTSGSAGPPGPARTEQFRAALQNVTSSAGA